MVPYNECGAAVTRAQAGPTLHYVLPSAEEERQTDADDAHFIFQKG